MSRHSRREFLLLRRGVLRAGGRRVQPVAHFQWERGKTVQYFLATLRVRDHLRRSAEAGAFKGRRVCSSLALSTSSERWCNGTLNSATIQFILVNICELPTSTLIRKSYVVNTWTKRIELFGTDSIHSSGHFKILRRSSLFWSAFMNY